MSEAEKPGTNPVAVARNKLTRQLRDVEYSGPEVRAAYEEFESALFGLAGTGPAVHAELVQMTSALVTTTGLRRDDESVEYFSGLRNRYRGKASSD